MGYQVRFTDRTSSDTRIKVMTDGILLAELQRDRQLRRYDTIIIDEAHERSLNIDFLLGYLKQLLPRRPDLKLVITSATIDPERFARHFAEVSTGSTTGPARPASRAGADHRGLRADLSGRDPLPTRSWCRPARPARRSTRRARSSSATRPRRSSTPSVSSRWRGRATSSSSCPASARSATPPTPSPTSDGSSAAAPSRSCRSTPGSRLPSSTACSPPTRRRSAASCSPRTSPRPR